MSNQVEEFAIRKGRHHGGHIRHRFRGGGFPIRGWPYPYSQPLPYPYPYTVPSLSLLDLKRKEAELKLKEAELKLKELELKKKAAAPVVTEYFVRQ